MLLLFWREIDPIDPIRVVDLIAKPRPTSFERTQPITAYQRKTRITEWTVTGNGMQKQSFAMNVGEAIFITMRFLGVSNFTGSSVTSSNTSAVTVTSSTANGNAITTLLAAPAVGWSDVKFTATLADGQTLIEVVAVYVS